MSFDERELIEYVTSRRWYGAKSRTVAHSQLLDSVILRAAEPQFALALVEMRYETGAHELYDLKNDIGETHDLASEKPEVAMRLARKLDDWRHKTGAQMPVQNPDWQAPASGVESE